MDNSYAKAKVVNLADCVQYQSGGIVSREIIKCANGTITLFAFARGQGLSEHTAPFDALVQILEGEALICLGGKRHIVRAGESLTMPAGAPHWLSAEVEFKMMLTMIRS